MIAAVFQVAIGGAVGASLRFVLVSAVAFPIGTLVVNVAGSFAMGVVFVLLAERGEARWIPFAMAGVLGGFTTFSAFSLDLLKLYESGRYLAAGSYLLASVILSVLALVLAVILARGMQH